MKKIAFFCCALFALGFASCDDKSDMGIFQTNSQLPAVSASDVKPELAAALGGSTLDLNGVSQIDAVSAPAIEDMPAGAELVFEMQLATKADFSDAVVIPVKDGKVSADEWNTYYRDHLGMNNTPLTNYVRFAAYFDQGTQRVRVGEIDDWYFSKALTVTPKSFTYPMATVMTPDGEAASWQIADFTGDGAKYAGFAYIKKDFTIVLDGVTYGKKGSNGLEAGSTTPCTVSSEGLYMVEINYDADKDNRTFKTTLVRSFGAIGDFNKWARQVNLTRNGTKFTGDVDFGQYLETANTFRFRMSNNNNLTLGGFMLDLIPGGEAMEIPGEGVYTLTVDISKIPYTYTFVNK